MPVSGWLIWRWSCNWRLPSLRFDFLGVRELPVEFTSRQLFFMFLVVGRGIRFGAYLLFVVVL